MTGRAALEPIESHLRYSRQLKGLEGVFRSNPSRFGNGQASHLADSELQKTFRKSCQQQGERRGPRERHKLLTSLPGHGTDSLLESGDVKG